LDEHLVHGPPPTLEEKLLFIRCHGSVGDRRDGNNALSHDRKKNNAKDWKSGTKSSEIVSCYNE
jgi:hypothetical protein